MHPEENDHNFYGFSLNQKKLERIESVVIIQLGF